MKNQQGNCWYCQLEYFASGYNFYLSDKTIHFKGEIWHPQCLSAYLKVRRFIAKDKGVQNPLSDNLLTTRKPLGLTKYARNNIISGKQ